MRARCSATHLFESLVMFQSATPIAFFQQQTSFFSRKSRDCSTGASTVFTTRVSPHDGFARCCRSPTSGIGARWPTISPRASSGSGAPSAGFATRRPNRVAAISRLAHPFCGDFGRPRPPPAWSAIVLLRMRKLVKRFERLGVARELARLSADRHRRPRGSGSR